jgi:hypothetical protein
MKNITSGMLFLSGLVLMLTIGSAGAATEVGMASLEQKAVILADAFSSSNMVVALVQNKASSNPKDFVLKNGANLMESNFIDLYSKSKVQYVNVVREIRGSPDKIIVFNEPVVLGGGPCFIPPPGSTWIIALKPTSAPELQIRWPNDKYPPMPVFDLVDRSAAIIKHEDTEEDRALVDDLVKIAERSRNKKDDRGKQQKAADVDFRSKLGGRIATIVKAKEDQSERGK